MKLKYTFVINTVAGQMVAVPINCGKGEQSIIKTNETGAFILEKLQNDTTKQQLLDEINQNFEVASQEELTKWVDSFIEKLKKADVLCDE